MNMGDEKRQRRKRRFLRVQFAIAASLCLPLLYLATVPMLWWLSIPYPSILEPMQYPLSNALAQIALTLPIVMVGFRFFYSGLKALFQRSPNMDTLIAIGSLASIAYSLYSTYQITIGNFGASDGLYFSSAGTIITLSLLGKLQEASTRGKVSKKIKKHVGKAPTAVSLEVMPSTMHSMKKTDTLSGYYVPIIGALAIIAAGAWLVGGQTSTFAITVFFSVLIVACPSSLGIAGPAAIAQSTRKGAKQGILIKGTEAFETAGKIGTVVLGTQEICENKIVAEDTSPTLTVKENCRNAIQLLQNLGIEVVLVTDENHNDAENVAKQAGILRVLAGIPPQDMQNAVKRLQSEGKKVAVIGNSASDAPSLLQADAGITIGPAADKAIAAAEIVLVRNDLSDVAAAIKLCRRTMRIFRGNLFWAFGYHVVSLPVAAGLLHTLGGPLMNPVLATAAMILGAVSIFANTLRLKKKCR